MTHRRVLQLFAAAATVVAFALPTAASAHPEECANTSVLASGPTADWFADWTAESEGCMSAAATRNFDDSGTQLAAGESEGTPNLTLTSNTPKAPPFEATTDFNSDLAFENGYAYGGNYDGVQIWDVRDNETPRLASFIHCPGSQNDVTVNDGILVTSTDSIRNKAECDGNVSVPTTSPEYGQPTNWEGLRIFDVRNPYSPKYLGAVRTDCGSAHPHGAARA